MSAGRIARERLQSVPFVFSLHGFSSRTRHFPWSLLTEPPCGTFYLNVAEEISSDIIVNFLLNAGPPSPVFRDRFVFSVDEHSSNTDYDPQEWLDRRD